MEKYSVVINGSQEKTYEVSIASESNLEWANQSYGWFGLNKILVAEGMEASDKKWSEILTIAQKICDGLNNNYVALKKELEVTNTLLTGRQKVLDAIPECELHGSCVPHALEWIEEMKRKYG